MKNTKKRLLLLLTTLLPVLFSCAGKQDSGLDIKSEADLSGLRVVALAGSHYDMKLSPRKDISLLLYNTASDCLQALITNKADVLVNDEIVFNSVIRKDNGIKIAFLGEHGFPTAFMFRKDGADLARTCTEVQQRMKADGTMQRLKDYWLTDQYVQAESFTHIDYEADGQPIRVATVASTAPIGFQSGDDWYGIEMDILRELGKELRRPLEIKFYNSSSCIMALKAGLADVACGCIFITPKRSRSFCSLSPTIIIIPHISWWTMTQRRKNRVC